MTAPKKPISAGGSPKKYGKRKVLSLSLPRKLDRQVRAAAKRCKVTVSQYVRDAIEATIK